MPTITDQVLTGIAGTDLEPYRLVKLTGEKTYGYCAAGDRPDGFTEYGALSGKFVAVTPPNKQGTVKLLTAGTVAVNSYVYPGADGKVTASVTGEPIGKALTGVTGAGLIEVMPVVGFNDVGNIAEVISFSDDFTEGFNTVATTGKWKKGGDAAASALVIDAAGGVLDVLCGANDNDQVIFSSQNEIFKPAAGKDITFLAHMTPVEAATNDSGWFIGLSDDDSADQLADNTMAIRATFDGFGFYKMAGDLLIRVVSSNGATQTAASSGVSMVSGVPLQLRMETEDDGTTMTIRFYIDGALVATHTKLLAGMDEMHVMVVEKTGHTGAERHYLDLIRCNQLR